jgi:uncharacterized membrane protein
MTILPLTQASLAIQFHALAALVALGLGILQLLMRKGGRRHRLFGYIWLLSMLIVAISSFWIHEIKVWGDFSPIHLLSLFTLVQVPRAVLAARHGNIRAHKIAMQFLFWLALVGAGLFTLLPGRIMGHMILGV